jgi:hypothetical protein
MPKRPVIPKARFLRQGTLRQFWGFGKDGKIKVSAAVMKF